ncbi:hypothetical protein [Arenibaculum pallidiluteum]|uniref:hypothetical protein n=1 Tax=Arenibaculum pallidiluteum TaxID=2812559 RepID=UPI001A95F5AB|nr:hypothetical protein [Arenibaculum pallidiluteum]
MSQYGSDYGRQYGHQDEHRRYPDEGYYGASDDVRDRDYPRGGYYDRDYGRDYGQGSQNYGSQNYGGQNYGGQGYGEQGYGEQRYVGQQSYRREDQGMRHYADDAREWVGTTAGIGTGAAILAVAAFGIGFLVGSRWHADSQERISGMPRSDLRRAPTLDNYHRHVSINDPDAEAGTPPDADEVVGHEPSGKSARESAETLRDAEGSRTERRETATAGEGGKRGKS